MKNLGKYAFKNGKIIPVRQACIHVYDLGMMRGMAVFDFLRFLDGTPLFIKDHLDRLFQSAHIFGIPTLFSKAQYTQAIETLIAKNKQRNGTIRIMLSAGPITDGFTITEPQVIILVEPYYKLPDACFDKGVTVITETYKRPLALAKHTHYAAAGINDKRKKKARAVEILYVDEKGFVTEASTSNICMIKKGVLYTPKSNVLGGITLIHVLKIAKKLNIKCVIKDFKLKELLGADEVFITATNKDVLPVTRVDEHVIGTGIPGTITKTLLSHYKSLIHAAN